jgi:hypothetical protein
MTCIDYMWLGISEKRNWILLWWLQNELFSYSNNMYKYKDTSLITLILSSMMAKVLDTNSILIQRTNWDNFWSKYSTPYLQILLSVKHNAFCFDFSILNVYFVPTKNNGYVFTHSNEVTMPIWHILVGNSRSNIKHYNGTLSLKQNAQSSNEAILSQGIPMVLLTGPNWYWFYCF